MNHFLTLLQSRGIIALLKEEIRLMAEIDKVIDKYGGWPIK